MADISGLVKTTLEEIEKMLTTRTVVGEPITIEGRTLIPLISIGFGFGAGGGFGKGEGGGTGGGAGIKPVAIVIIEKDTVRVEPVVGGLAGALEKVGEALPRLVEKIVEKMPGKKE